MSNIVLLDREVRKTGRERWDEKNQKKYVIQYAIVAVFAIIGVVTIIRYPTNLLPIIVVAALMFASLYIYTRNEITKPRNEYAEQFLKDYRS
jgi:protein-S-isoprenylcysteine O-methyltransferase Ste14